MKIFGNQIKLNAGAIGFCLLGIVFVVAVFILTEDWLRRLHAIIVGTINIGAALYLRHIAQRKNEIIKPEQGVAPLRRTKCAEGER